MKIHLLLKRGLGNQMFQYAAGLFFAKRYGADLEIIRESQTDAFSFGHPRPFLLSNFCISTSVREHTKWDRLVCSVALAKKPLAVSARLASRTVVYRQHFRVDWTFLPDLPIAKSTEHVYVEGNFQACARQFAQDVEANFFAKGVNPSEARLGCESRNPRADPLGREFGFSPCSPRRLRCQKRRTTSSTARVLRTIHPGNLRKSK